MSEHQLPSQLEQNEIMILPFSVQVGSETLEFFLNIHKVLKVFEPEHLSALPATNTSGAFQYLFDFQGMSVPVLNLGAWLREKEAASEPPIHRPTAGHGRLLICQVMDFVVGVLVEQTRKVRRVCNAEIAPPPELMQESYAFINAVLKHDNNYCFMLDLEYFLQISGVSISAESSGRVEDVDLSKLRVLVVEDSRFFRQLAEQVFHKYGSQVMMAENGKAGLELLRAQRFDIVISDIEMPIMNGLEMIRCFQAEYPDHQSAIVFHSSLSNEVLIRDIEQEGLGMWLSKFDESALIDLIASIIAAKAAA